MEWIIYLKEKLSFEFRNFDIKVTYVYNEFKDVSPALIFLVYTTIKILFLFDRFYTSFYLKQRWSNIIFVVNITWTLVSRLCFFGFLFLWYLRSELQRWQDSSPHWNHIMWFSVRLQRNLVMVTLLKVNTRFMSIA